MINELLVPYFSILLHWLVIKLATSYQAPRLSVCYEHAVSSIVCESHYVEEWLCCNTLQTINATMECCKHGESTEKGIRFE
jgi:hypothetical protein